MLELKPVDLNYVAGSYGHEPKLNSSGNFKLHSFHGFGQTDARIYLPTTYSLY